MKYLNFFLTLITLITISGCKPDKKSKDYLSVTIEPQHFFLDQIVRGKYEIKTLIPPGNNPENYDPTPSQMIALENSKGYFKLGLLEIENILLEKINAQNQLSIIDCSSGIDIINNHEHCDHSNHKITGHGHDIGDPHYWTSISSAKQILTNMYEGMIKIDQDNKDFYNQNYKKAILMVDSVHNQIDKILNHSQSNAFMIYHPALSYYAKEFNLKQLSIEYDGKSPSPNHLKNIIDSAKVENVKVIFIQKEFDTKNAEIIAKQIQADTCSINLLSYDWPETMIYLTTKIRGNDGK